MASKMSMILSFIFVCLLIALAGDIIGVQLAYTELDDVSMSCGYIISKEGNVDKAIALASSKNMEFISETSGAPMFGETYYFTLTRKYKALVMSKDEMILVINRSTVVGYYS